MVRKKLMATAKANDRAAPCPCGSSTAYADCCGRYHASMPAPTAEALMRSRYSAFVRGDVDYLLATWHPATRPGELDLGTPAPTWLGLEVRGRGAIDADHAWVEFVARWRLGGGRAQRQHERSRFERIDGRWYYLAAE